MMHIVSTALPSAFEFDLSRTALVIIDMQRDFVETGRRSVGIYHRRCILRE